MDMKSSHFFLFAALSSLCSVPVLAQPIRAPYYNAHYNARGYSTENITVRKKGEDPFAHRSKHQGVNMEAWEQNRMANPSQRAPINQPAARTPQAQQSPEKRGRDEGQTDPMHRSGR